MGGVTRWAPTIVIIGVPGLKSPLSMTFQCAYKWVLIGVISPRNKSFHLTYNPDDPWDWYIYLTIFASKSTAAFWARRKLETFSVAGHWSPGKPRLGAHGIAVDVRSLRFLWHVYQLLGGSPQLVS